MKEKYKMLGLDYDLIASEFPDLNEYETVVSTYFTDPFFLELREMIEAQDYEMVKDAAKGLYFLAQDLKLYPLYYALVEIYADIEEETVNDLMKHYEEMLAVYQKMRGVFCA